MKVYLVGAGPGDPGLLTLRAVECLREADFVLYDYLTSARTLDFARPEAERFRVTQLPGTHPERWQHITAKIIEEARKGKVVVHLKGGDPLIFGRGSEEAEVLRAAGIPYEIVPGVTAALAAAATTEIPLTHRACASAVAFVTGHEEPGKGGSQLDWDLLARFPGTLAIYMGVTQLRHIVDELTARGMPKDFPAALVYKASVGEQQTVAASLGELEAAVRRVGLGRPSLVLIGSAVAKKPEQSWFEARPLAGMRVVVTRPRAQAMTFVRKLELLGAIPEILPVIDIRPPDDWTAVDAAIQRLRNDHFDWLVFTSANGVTAFLDRLYELKFDARAIGRTKIAAIGPATATALLDRQLKADLTPAGDSRSEVLAESLAEHCRGQRLILAQAGQGRELLRDELRCIANVDAVSVYQQVNVLDPQSPTFERLRRGEVDAVTLTSPNIATAFLTACDAEVLARFRDGSIVVVANSDRLASQLRAAELPVVVAEAPTVEGVIVTLMRLRRTNQE